MGCARPVYTELVCSPAAIISVRLSVRNFLPGTGKSGGGLLSPSVHYDLLLILTSLTDMSIKLGNTIPSPMRWKRFVPASQRRVTLPPIRTLLGRITSGTE